MVQRFRVALASYCAVGFALLHSGCADDGAGLSAYGSGDDSQGIVTEGLVDTSAGADTGTTGNGSGGMADDTGTTAATVGGPGSTGSGGSGTGSPGGTGSGTDGGSGSTGSGGGIPCDRDTDCDDLQFCKGVEFCGADGLCVAGDAPDCADMIDCTTDACDEVADACITIADDAQCDDDMFCNGAETCDPLSGCQPGTPPDCDDAVDCTVDTCDDDAASCVHTADDTPCQDTEFCNGEEVCDPIAGCQPAAGPTDCNDLTACTVDSCDEDADACINAPDDGVCDNGLFCDGAETCQSGLGCLAGAPVVCADDGIECTLEACDEVGDACATALDNQLCIDAGLDFCTDTGCEQGDPCDEDADCDDGQGCNGIETCDTSTDPGVCQAGPPVVCGDGTACTSDACEELGGNATQCVNTPNDVACSDGNPCNGDEVCDAVTGCESGAPLDCDDGVGCTDDSCIPAFGCFSPPNDLSCDDGVVCNGGETCDPVADCQPADAPLACPDDGIPCTVESCDEDFGGCTTVPDDTVCECGLHCDPTAPGADAGGSPDACSVALCDGTLWQRGDCIDNEGDCDVDSGDADCFGACDNNEAGFDGGIPGQNSAPCKADCYFDDESGAGGGDCVWSLACDPLDPQPDDCICDPEPGEMFCDANVPGAQGATCDELFTMQPANCEDLCGPITPNGCDCFGCCEVTLADMTQTTVYLGSENGGDPSCDASVVNNPALCHPCTQVEACLNPCDDCELCFGDTTLPPECGGTPTCEGETQPCGVPGLPSCPPGEFCLTGCCAAF